MEDIQLKGSWKHGWNSLKLWAELFFIFLFKCEELLNLQLKGNCQTWNIYKYYTYIIHIAYTNSGNIDQWSNKMNQILTPTKWHQQIENFMNIPSTAYIPTETQPINLDHLEPKKSPASVPVTHVLLQDHHCPCLVKSEFHPQQKCCKKSTGWQGGWVILTLFLPGCLTGKILTMSEKDYKKHAAKLYWNRNIATK